MSCNIFICCHKDYDNVGIVNENYVLVSDKSIKTDGPLQHIITDGFLDERLYCELSKHYFIWKNMSNNLDYIGMCHYRRYFDFMNDIPNDPEFIIPVPINQPFNNAAMYGIYHNLDDLLSVGKIISEKYKTYYDAFVSMMDSHYLIPYNMFILKKDLYEEYMEFLFGVLFDHMKITEINDDVKRGLMYISNHSQKYIKNFHPNNTVEYQLRSMFGGLGERISSAFFIYLMTERKIKPNYTKINITEHTYNKF